LEQSITDPRDDDRLHPSPEQDAAFAALVRSVRDRIHGWARRFSGDADDAEDIAQEVLLRLHRKVHTFEGRSVLSSWLYRLTWNAAHDRRVTQRRRSALLERFSDGEASASAPDVTAPLDPDGIAELVRSYRTELTPRQREVFTMVDLEQRSVAEVAEELGITPSTVRVLLARARQTIRLRMLAEHPDLLEGFDR
jgi:RNA polymerase sigma-70 factor (ECF subfamily)